MATGLITVQGDKKLMRLFNKLAVSDAQHRSIAKRAATIVKTQTRRKLRKYTDTGELARNVLVKGIKRGALVCIDNQDKSRGSSGSKYKITNKTLFKIISLGDYKNKGYKRTAAGSLIKIAAGEVEGKVKNSLAKNYGTLLRNKIRKY